jgi:hypothetical protein
MANDMPVEVEVWPVAADAAGVWLVSGDGPWMPWGPVQSDSEPHAEVELLLASHGAVFDTVLVHSTSWRTDLPRLVLTYVVVVNAGDPVRVRWPDALPVSLQFASAVGRPPTHGAVEAPLVRDADVLLHGLRHLSFLLQTDATAAGCSTTTGGRTWRGCGRHWRGCTRSSTPPPDSHGSRHMSSLVSVCAVFVPWWCADGELQDSRLRPLRRDVTEGFDSRSGHRRLPRHDRPDREAPLEKSAGASWRPRVVPPPRAGLVGDVRNPG